MTERVRRTRGGEPTRVRRTRESEEVPARVRRVREEPLEEAPVPISGIKIKWQNYKGSSCLYIGSYLFGIVSVATGPHLGSINTYAGHVQVPGICGPVAIGPGKLRVMTEVRNKALEWLKNLCNDPPVLEQDEPAKKRGRR